MKPKFLLGLPLVFLFTYAGILDGCKDDKPKDSPTAPLTPLEGVGWRFTGPVELTEGCLYKLLGEARGGRKPYSFSWKSASSLLTGERSGESVEVKVPFGTVADLEILMTVTDGAGQSAGPVAGTIPVRCLSSSSSFVLGDAPDGWESLGRGTFVPGWESAKLKRSERDRLLWRSPNGPGNPKL